LSISQAVIASHRLGLGPHPGDLELIKADPKAWLLSQIGAESDVVFLSSQEVLELQSQIREARNQQNESQIQEISASLRRAGISDAAARIRQGIETKTPFAERLVHFWSNHFAISLDKGAVSGLGGSFEGEAIRPHVFGRFEELLLASTTHPGMLLYLDNAQSIGPNSQAGSRRNRGINENLAREILELHTLGVRGGYSQEDVTNFAKILTGWSVAAPQVSERANTIVGSFAYLERAHEPGRHTLLGKSYADNGMEQGLAVLKDLATHEKTAEHIATKLARHFIADEPPLSAIEALKNSFLQSGGDLSSLYKTLVELDQVWQPSETKIRTPQEWMTAILRGVGDTNLGRRALRDNQLVGSLNTLGQPVWRPGSPAGWPDEADRWTGSDALGKRIEWANTVAQQLAGRLPAEQWQTTLFGTSLDENLASSVARAESNAQALVLVAMAPGMMRR
jgi:uncharacterized protein (DUF1800 family)